MLAYLLPTSVDVIAIIVTLASSSNFLIILQVANPEQCAKRIGTMSTGEAIAVVCPPISRSLAMKLIAVVRCSTGLLSYNRGGKGI